MGFSARILLDSISPAGVRLTTMEVTFPRFILSEFNTHRTFCLEENTKLYFDLPAGKEKRQTQRFTMTLREFYEKWNEGAAPRRNRERTIHTDALCMSATYSAKELAPLVGYRDYTAVDLVTRRASIPRVKVTDGPYRVRGLDFARWVYSEGTNRQPIRERLRAMNLRSCNEDTGEIYHTRVNDICYSGKKDVFRVVLTDGREILSSKDHQFLTSKGWQRLEDAVGLELSANGIATWRHSAELAVNGVEAYRDDWLKAQRDAGYSASAIADIAGAPKKKRAMLRHFLPVERVEYVGVRETYDIEVKGPYHNFVADGFIVHNSRNSASSRAIPTSKLIKRVEEEPAMPVEWGKNKKGMSADEELDAAEQAAAVATWLSARDCAVENAKKFADQHVHKQITNRILEPFMWHTVIVTATEWDNFYELRCAPNAQPEIRVAATMMRQAYAGASPKALAIGEWHLPLLQDDERALPIEEQKKISVARCARVSYLTHDGKRNVEADLELFTRLKSDRHLSPFEHVATPSNDTEFHANFRGWIQMRKQIEAELPRREITQPA